MSSLRALLLVAAAAVAPASRGCRTPRVRLEATRMEATRPELVLLRCRPSGFAARPRFTWKLPPGVRVFTAGEPLDEEALQVQIIDGAHGALPVECTALDEPDTASARISLGSCQISSAKPAAGRLTVEGNGFGDVPGSDDAVWLVPARGAAVRADHACKDASWGDTRVVACLPSLPPSKSKKSYQVRVESGGRLALGPPVELP